MIERHENASSFLERVGARLIEDEARYHLILGIARRLEEHPDATPKDAYFATIDDDYGVIGAAIMTPPNGLVTTSLGARALGALMDDLGERVLPSVHAPRETSDAFAKEWSARHRRACKPHWDLRVHALDAVADVKMASGALRKARVGELAFYARWVDAFREAVDDHDPLDAREVAKRHLAAGSAYFWEDGGAVVSTALATGATPHGIRIGAVYTPKELRGRGYATSCVAALSRAMLGSGRRWCFLYTDAKNPTSNAIYARIGYRPVADFREWLFATDPGGSIVAP